MAYVAATVYAVPVITACVQIPSTEGRSLRKVNLNYLCSLFSNDHTHRHPWLPYLTRHHAAAAEANRRRSRCRSAAP